MSQIQLFRLANVRGREARYRERSVSEDATISSAIDRTSNVDVIRSFDIWPMRMFKVQGMVLHGAVAGQTYVSDVKVGNYSVLNGTELVDSIFFIHPSESIVLVEQTQQFLQLTADEIARREKFGFLKFTFPTCPVGASIRVLIGGPCLQVSLWGKVVLPILLPVSRSIIRRR
jgi:hypothetical protein